MPWGSGKGSRLPARRVGSRKVVTALLLGVAANTPDCRLDGGVEAEKGVCVTERGRMARAGKTTMSSLSSEVVCGWGSVETRVLPNVESSE